MAILLYDGACGFCRLVAALVIAIDRRYRILPLSIDSPEGAALLADLSHEARHRSFHVVDGGGRHSEGAALAALQQHFIGRRTVSGLLSRCYQPVFLALHTARPHVGPRLPAAWSHRWAKAALTHHQRRARMHSPIQTLLRDGRP